jgi:hypothetical protein
MRQNARSSQLNKTIIHSIIWVRTGSEQDIENLNVTSWKFHPLKVEKVSWGNNWFIKYFRALIVTTIVSRANCFRKSERHENKHWARQISVSKIFPLLIFRLQPLPTPIRYLLWTNELQGDWQRLCPPISSGNVRFWGIVEEKRKWEMRESIFHPRVMNRSKLITTKGRNVYLNGDEKSWV